jgi:hypothetical protein
VIIESVTVTLIWLVFQAATPSEVDVTVCQVLQRATALDGKMVRLRARVASGPESTYLADPACSDSIWLAGKEYPPLINIAFPGDRVALKSPASFSWDVAGIHRLFSDSHLIETQPWVIAVGRIESFPLSRGRIRGARGDLSGRVLSFGFGHLNGLPAQLVVRTMRLDEE